MRTPEAQLITLIDHLNGEGAQLLALQQQGAQPAAAPMNDLLVFRGEELRAMLDAVLGVTSSTMPKLKNYTSSTMLQLKNYTNSTMPKLKNAVLGVTRSSHWQTDRKNIFLSSECLLHRRASVNNCV